MLWFDVNLKKIGLALFEIIQFIRSDIHMDMIFFERSKDAVFIVIQLCYIVLWLFSHYKWAKIEEVVKMKPVWE